jgi:hypothetical protein
LTEPVEQSEPTVAFGYILDESSFSLSVTSALHCLVAMSANPPCSTPLKGRAMSRYGMGLMVLMACVVFAAARHPSLSSHMTMDTAKGSVPEFSDEQRGRIFDGVMRISDAPLTEVAAPEVADSLPEEVPMQELRLPLTPHDRQATPRRENFISVKMSRHHRQPRWRG